MAGSAYEEVLYLRLVQTTVLFPKNVLSHVKSLSPFPPPVKVDRVACNTAFCGVRVGIGILRRAKLASQPGLQ